MTRIRLMLRRADAGASAVEYGLVVFAVAATVVAIVFLLGSTVEATFADTCTAIRDAATVTGSCVP